MENQENKKEVQQDIFAKVYFEKLRDIELFVDKDEQGKLFLLLYQNVERLRVKEEQELLIDKVTVIARSLLEQYEALSEKAKQVFKSQSKQVLQSYRAYNTNFGGKREGAGRKPKEK